MRKDDFYVGVPCSRLQKWLSERDYLIATDEGEAVAIAAGHWLSTGIKAGVFMQSDGLCNALNPLTSLIIPYEIPVHLIISLRTKGPQHEVMGRYAEDILELIQFNDYEII